jgi:serine/threonine protein kinase
LAPQGGIVLGGRYQLDRRIAAGAMGDVWRAVDQVLDRPVAVKILRHELSEQPGFLDRFRREARLAGMLSHPGIATVFDYGEQDGSAYLVMELVEGDNLAVELARQRLMPTDRVVDLLIQIADALAAAHAAGIVHRDIKPANVMISRADKVKITDFGISRLGDSSALTATGDVLGTPQYMAPEQVTGQPATPASDVYSAGVVAYEMLVGRPPFARDSKIAAAMAQLHELPPPLPDRVPTALARVIGRMLAKDPQVRPADGAEMARELSALPDRTMSRAADPHFAPTIASGADPPLIGPLNRHRRKRMASSLAAAVLVLALVVIVLLTRTDTADDAALPGSTAGSTPAADLPLTTAATAATVAATSPPTATDTVVIDPVQYLGRDHRDVIDELRVLGLEVNELTGDAQPGTKKNTVIAVEPSGPVPLGSTVTVTVAGKPGKGP